MTWDNLNNGGFGRRGSPPRLEDFPRPLPTCDPPTTRRSRQAGASARTTNPVFNSDADADTRNRLIAAIMANKASTFVLEDFADLDINLLRRIAAVAVSSPGDTPTDNRQRSGTSQLLWHRTVDDNGNTLMHGPIYGIGGEEAATGSVRQVKLPTGGHQMPPKPVSAPRLEDFPRPIPTF